MVGVGRVMAVYNRLFASKAAKLMGLENLWHSLNILIGIIEDLKLLNFRSFFVFIDTYPLRVYNDYEPLYPKGVFNKFRPQAGGRSMIQEDFNKSTCCGQDYDGPETDFVKEDDSGQTGSRSACSCATKYRTDKEIKNLTNRLSRIEGQIRGIKRMVEEGAYCIDILNQVSAANCALNSFTKLVLADHIKSCVAEDVREGKEDKLDELVRTLQKLMK